MDLHKFPTKQLERFVAVHLDVVMEDMRVFLDRVSAAAQLASTAHSGIQDILHNSVVEWAASNRGSESGCESGNGAIMSLLQDMQSAFGQNFHALGRRLDRVDTLLESMDRRITLLEGTGEPVSAPTGESVDRASHGTKTNVPGSRSYNWNWREPVQSHQVPAGSSHARGAYGTDQPPGALCADSLLAIVRGPPSVRGSANSPEALNRGAEAHVNRSYSNNLVVPREELADVPLRLPCLCACESDDEGTDTGECEFHMPKDPESPYFVEPGPVPPGTRRPSGWLEKWVMSRRHVAITFSEAGVPRIEVFDSETDLMDAGSVYVWTGPRVYLEAAGFLNMHEPTLREIGQQDLAAESDGSLIRGETRDEPTSPLSVADGSRPASANAHQTRLPLGGPPQGDKVALSDRIQAEEPAVTFDHGSDVGGAQIEVPPGGLPDETAPCPRMIRSALGDQVFGVDTRTSSAEAPTGETQGNDEGFPRLVRAHLGDPGGRKRLRRESTDPTPSATTGQPLVPIPDAIGRSVAERTKSNRRACSAAVSTPAVRAGPVPHDPARGMGRGGAGNVPADNLDAGGATQLGRLVAATDKLVAQQTRVADITEAGENNLHKRKNTSYGLQDAPNPTTWEKCVVSLLTGCGTHRGCMVNLSQSASPFTELNSMFGDLARLAKDFGINIALTNRLVWAMVQGYWTNLLAEDFPPVRSITAQVAVSGLKDFKMPKEVHIKAASTIEQWANLARQQVKLFVALYGMEHGVERLNFIRYLEMLNNTQCARYPLKWVRAVWAKAWKEYDVEVAALLRRIQGLLSDLSMFMSPQNLRVAMCMPASSGAQAVHQLFEQYVGFT